MVLKKVLEWLRSLVTEEESVKVGSFDLIGSKEKAVAVIEVGKRPKDNVAMIAAEIVKMNKNVKSVLAKLSGRSGKLRLGKYVLVAGDKNTEVVHKEYGCMIKVDPRKVYFSPREATERQRVAAQVKAGETVMVMFSGVAPYPIQIVKKQPKVKEVIAVEINPDGVEYAIENMKLNKIPEGKIMPVLGDVKEVCPRFYGMCDRVIMPLPLEADSFLDMAVRCIKKDGGVVHFYHWGEEKDPYSKGLKIVDKVLKSVKKRYEVLDKRMVLPYAPRTHKVCIEFKAY